MQNPKALSDSLLFKLASAEDFEVLLSLYSASFNDKSPQLPFLEGIINDQDTYCALLDGRPVAMVTANPVTYQNQKGHQIFKLCTDKAVRGRGIAGKLLDFMHREQRKKGDRFSLVMPGNDDLYGFYAAKGYLPIAAKTHRLLQGDAVCLPQTRVVYTEKYSGYVLKSAKANGKRSADGNGLLWGYEREGTVVADDCFGDGLSLQAPCVVHLPCQEGNERYGMVCPLDPQASLQGIFPVLVCGFQK